MTLKINVNFYLWFGIGTATIHYFHKIEAWNLKSSCLFFIMFGPPLITQLKGTVMQIEKNTDK